MVAEPIPYVDLAAQAAEEGADLRQAVEQVLARGDFVLGAAVAELEARLATFIGVNHVVSVNSGTDALILALEALGIGPGDEVVTAANSFIATTAAIVRVGARPVFADVGPDQNLDPDAVARVMGPRCRGILCVHLTGRICDMDALNALAQDHGVPLIEDAAQAIGARWRGRMAGSFGVAGCFSAHPLKNLNACGDAGFIAVNDADLAERLRRLRNLGQADRNTVVDWGTVSRLDTLQAAVLAMRLDRLPDVLTRRAANAACYRERLDPDRVWFPSPRPEAVETYHTFVVQVDHRDALRTALADQGIATAIHYPVPIHLQPVATDLGYGPGSLPVTERQSGRILTLPVHQFLTAGQVGRIAEAVNDFLAGAG